MKLYILRNSPNCRKVLATANYLNADVEYVYFELDKGQTQTPEFLAINPNGKTPTLEDNGFVVWESNAVIQYLSDKQGDNNLYPQDIKQRTNINRWLFWEANNYGPAVGDILWESFAKEMFMGEPGSPEALHDALSRFHQQAPILDKQLSQTDYVAGDEVSLADFALACHAGFISMAQVPVEEYPALAAWYQRLNTLPAWKESAPLL